MNELSEEEKFAIQLSGHIYTAYDLVHGGLNRLADTLGFVTINGQRGIRVRKAIVDFYYKDQDFYVLKDQQFYFNWVNSHRLAMDDLEHAGLHIIVL